MADIEIFDPDKARMRQDRHKLEERFSNAYRPRQGKTQSDALPASGKDDKVVPLHPEPEKP